ncbi:MAG: ABC transporter permease [SAR202 cluster bacterium]|nr:ABC transporter permease [SAR202 cluster bacterium]
MSNALTTKTSSLPETVYSPEFGLRRPGLLLRSMVRDLRAARPLGWELAKRDISAKYRQSLLGIAWKFVPPVMTAFIFIALNSRKVITIDTGNVPYPVFVLIGTVLWRMFTASLMAPLTAVQRAKPMLAKLNFPREAIIVSSITQVLYEFCISLVILAVLFVAFGLDLSIGVLLFPIAALSVMLLGFSIGLLLAPVGSLYSDAASFLTTITLPWMLITPVVYAAPRNGIIALVSRVNPVAPLITGSRELATEGAMSDPVSFAVVVVASLVGVFLGLVLYRLVMPIIIEKMGG